MNARLDTERIVDAFLAPEIGERLADRVIDAALDDVARTRQQRALRVPWRFPLMPALTRTTGIAAVALVAVVGAGGLLYLNTSGPGGGGQPTPMPSTKPSTPPTIPSTADWTSYQSEVYSFTISYPSDWTVFARAKRPWQPGDGGVEDAPNVDIFAGPGQSIAMSALKVPVGTWGDDGTDRGLAAWVHAFCKDEGNAWCDLIPAMSQFICIRPENPDGTCPKLALLLPTPDAQYAFTRETFTSGVHRIIVVIVGRPDDDVAARKFGGSVNLLRAAMTTIRG